MNGENIVHLNLPNVLTIGIILLVWVVVWVVAGQGVRRALGAKTASDVQSAGLVAGGLPSTAV
jgi:hypothetical protein